MSKDAASAARRSEWALLELEQRSTALLAALQAGIAEVLRTSPERLHPDVPLPKAHRALAEPRQAYFILRTVVEKLLGFLMWPVELHGRNSLRELADYLAGELDPIPPPTGPPVTDPYGGTWAWGYASTDPLTPRLPRAAFLLSAPRCGSTLFRAMLAGHPGLYSPPELNLLPFDTMGARQKQVDELGYTWMRTGPAQALGAVHGWDQENAGINIARIENADRPVPDVYRDLIEGAGGRLLIDKSPLYALHPSWLARAEAWFEQPLYIFLLRHPYAVMESFVRMRFHRLLGPHWGLVHDNPWLLAERVWAVCNLHIAAFLSQVPAERQIVVHYERLVADPEGEGRRVCDFLGLEYDPGVANPYSGERMLAAATVGSERFPTIGDPNILRHSAIDPALATSWRKHRPPQTLGPFIREVAGAMGYDLPD